MGLGWVSEDKGGGVRGAKTKRKSSKSIVTTKLTYRKHKTKCLLGSASKVNERTGVLRQF